LYINGWCSFIAIANLNFLWQTEDPRNLPPYATISAGLTELAQSALAVHRDS
jgi:hypothetical protein